MVWLMISTTIVIDGDCSGSGPIADDHPQRYLALDDRSTVLQSSSFSLNSTNELIFVLRIKIAVLQ